MVIRVATVAFEGIEARAVDVQVQITPGAVAFTAVGLPDKAVKESRDRVTAAFAAQHNLKSIGDLAGITPLVLGGAPELEERPYGPTGLKEKYGVDVTFSATAATTAAISHGSHRNGRERAATGFSP